MANLSDKFFEVLSDYPGSVQDRMKAYLVSTYSYDSSLNVYDMEFLVLRDLGYTGTLDDMWKAYLVSLGGSGVSSKAALLGSTFYAGAGYSVNGFNPAYVTDFGAEFYRKSGATSTFSDSITHSAASNATMVDSDGLLKWRPHNLLLQSEFASGWSPYVATNSNGAITESSASNFQAVFQGGPSSVSTWTFKCKMVPAGRNFGALSIGPAAGTWAAATFDLVNGVVTKSDTAGAAVLEATSIVADGDGYICGITVSGISATYVYVASSETGTTAYSSYGLPTFLGSGSVALNASMAHLYRSDLGGMVNNPDRGDSYVPTTTSAVYLPRRGHHVYNGDSWVNKGLLHESEARTNTNSLSNEHDGVNYTAVALAVTVNSATSPDGSTNATNLVPDATTATHRLYGTSGGASLTAGGYVTMSGFFKANGYSQLAIRESAATGAAAVFDLSTGTVDGSHNAGVLTVTNTFVENFGDGWYRCSVTFLSSGTVSARMGVHVMDGGWTSGDPTSYTFAGNTTSGILTYGWQNEAASTPSSYIPTSGATVTRSAETLTVPAANLPYSSTAMSIQMQGGMTYADTGVNAELTLSRWYLDANNRIQHFVDTASTETGRVRFDQSALGTNDAVESSQDAYSPGVNVPFNIASRHGSTFINGAVDGTALTADTTPVALPDLSATDLQLGYDFMGTISLFRVWADDLTDAGIAEAST